MMSPLLQGLSQSECGALGSAARGNVLRFVRSTLGIATKSLTEGSRANAELFSWQVIAASSLPWTHSFKNPREAAQSRKGRRRGGEWGRMLTTGLTTQAYPTGVTGGARKGSQPGKLSQVSHCSLHCSAFGVWVEAEGIIPSQLFCQSFLTFLWVLPLPLALLPALVLRLESACLSRTVGVRTTSPPPWG